MMMMMTLMLLIPRFKVDRGLDIGLMLQRSSGRGRVWQMVWEREERKSIEFALILIEHTLPHQSRHNSSTETAQYTLNLCSSTENSPSFQRDESGGNPLPPVQPDESTVNFEQRYRTESKIPCLFYSTQKRIKEREKSYRKYRDWGSSSSFVFVFFQDLCFLFMVPWPSSLLPWTALPTESNPKGTGKRKNETDSKKKEGGVGKREKTREEWGQKKWSKSKGGKRGPFFLLL